MRRRKRRRRKRRRNIFFIEPYSFLVFTNYSKLTHMSDEDTLIE